MKPADSPLDLPSYRLFSPPAGESDDSARKRAWKGADFSFRDVLDVINPLQHLPVISTLYRWITGDTIGALPRIVGDGLYGGPIGLVAGLFNASIKQESGKDVGEQVIALLGGGDPPAPGTEPTAVAAAQQDTGPPQPTDGARGASPPPIVAAASAGSAAADSAPVGSAAQGAAAGGAIAASVQPMTVSAAHPPPPLMPPTPANLTARIGMRSPPGMLSAVDPADPRAAFLARASALHRQFADDDRQLPGRALSSKVVPLQGIALPPSLLRPIVPAAARATGPVGADTGAGTVPSNPPINISQQMMEALDKYARLQQQRDTKRDAGRGAQVDLSQ